MKDSSATRMMLVGDVSAINHPRGLGFILEKVAGTLREGDVVYANLEFPITDRGQFDMSKHWKVPLAMKPHEGKVLAQTGFHVMSMATNHIMDFGAEGMLRTVEILDENGIKHCGAGREREDAHKPAVIDKHGVRIAFLAYTSVFASTGSAGQDTPGMATVQVKTAFIPDPRVFEQPGTPHQTTYFPNGEELDRVRDDVRKAKEAADIVVVAWHWGVSGSRKHESYQTGLGRAAIDAGASLVIGHHSHVLQGVEVYKNGAIFYSLGDFACWSGEAPGETHERSTVIVDCQIDHKGFKEISLVPVSINSECQPEIAKENEGSHILHRLVSNAKALGTSFRNEGGRLLLEIPGRR